MSENISQVKEVLKDLVSVVNVQQRLAKADWKLVVKQVLDLDDMEAQEIAKDLEGLELNDKAVEALVEGYAHQGADYAPIVLRLIRIFVPKKSS